ncbi:Snf7-domain-containing protein [Powellomyces hirtus]|nr:Snf7-domain-containing protein [Powellomyces hirtus]
MNLLRKQPSAKEQVRATSREVRSVQRELGKDRASLERQERQLIQDIKKAAAQGRNADARTLAKHVTAIRAQLAKNSAVKSKVSGLDMRAKTMASNNVTASALQTATRVMAATNSSPALANLQKTTAEYQKQNIISEMNDEMLMDALGLADSDDEEEEEASTIVDSVMAEIGLDITTKAASVPHTLPMSAGQRQSTENRKAAQTETDEALIERLAGLNS